MLKRDPIMKIVMKFGGNFPWGRKKRSVIVAQLLKRYHERATRLWGILGLGGVTARLLENARLASTSGQRSLLSKSLKRTYKPTPRSCEATRPLTTPMRDKRSPPDPDLRIEELEKP
jgi:aspartate kinase